MTVPAVPKFTTGDQLAPLGGTLTRDPGDGSAVPVDGTQADSATVHIRRPDNTVISAPVTVGADGTWSYAWQAGDLTVAGSWSCEVELLFVGLPETFGQAYFRVTDQIA